MEVKFNITATKELKGETDRLLSITESLPQSRGLFRCISNELDVRRFLGRINGAVFKLLSVEFEIASRSLLGTSFCEL